MGTQLVVGSHRSLWKDTSPSDDTCVNVTCSSAAISGRKVAKKHVFSLREAPEHSLSRFPGLRRSQGSPCNGLSAAVRFPQPFLMFPQRI